MPERVAWRHVYRLIRVAIRMVAILVAVALLGAAVYEHVGDSISDPVVHSVQLGERRAGRI